jgi:hypothetical protein
MPTYGGLISAPFHRPSLRRSFWSRQLAWWDLRFGRRSHPGGESYHLPRIKLAYQRDGWEVFTVPAKESYLLRQMPYNMAREVAALWVYYLRPLVNA